MKFMCEVCNSTFTKQSNLHRHLKRIHNIITITDNKNLHKCVMCDFEGAPYQLREHYVSVHELKFEEETLHFEGDNSFKNWKYHVEKNTICKYLKLCGERNGITRYVCHRSGVFKSKSKEIRQIKAQGSKKIGAYCPAQMVVTRNSNNSLPLEVKFLKTHVGHENDLCHVTLSPNTKKKIAAKLLDGISAQEIVDEVRSSITSGKLERIHLLTNSDIYNISKEFGIKDGNDAVNTGKNIHHVLQCRTNNHNACNSVNSAVVNCLDEDSVADDCCNSNAMNETSIEERKAAKFMEDCDRLYEEAKSYCKDDNSRHFLKKGVENILSRLKSDSYKASSPSECAKKTPESKIKRGVILKPTKDLDLTPRKRKTRL